MFGGEYGKESRVFVSFRVYVFGLVGRGEMKGI